MGDKFSLVFSFVALKYMEVSDLLNNFDYSTVESQDDGTKTIHLSAPKEFIFRVAEALRRHKVQFDFYAPIDAHIHVAYNAESEESSQELFVRPGFSKKICGISDDNDEELVLVSLD